MNKESKTVNNSNNYKIQDTSINESITQQDMSTHNANATKLSNKIIAEICDFGLYKDEQLISYLSSKYQQIMGHPKIAKNPKLKSKFKCVFQDICQEFQVNWDSLNVS